MGFHRQLDQSGQDLTHDGVVPFYLTGEDEQHRVPLVRGRLARLIGPCQSILNRHHYPDGVAEICAEAMSLSACLSTTLKFDGVFTLQAKGDGALRTLFADVTSNGDLRCYAAFDEKTGQMPPTQPAQLARMMGGGYMAFTVDQNPALGEGAHRYQGIVELDGAYLGDCAVTWFKNSEQLSAQIITAATRTATGWRSAALFLQQLAGEGGASSPLSAEQIAESWHTVMVLMSSVKREELLSDDLSSSQLLYRLFHAQGLHIQPSRPIADKCRCSEDKVVGMLTGLSPEQLTDLCDETGHLRVNCEFCKTERAYPLDQFQK